MGSTRAASVGGKPWLELPNRHKEKGDSSEGEPGSGVADSEK